MRFLAELRLFVQLAESLHFGRTAEQCHVTPSTLSRCIARLEADVGYRLFSRDRRSVQLTADGVRLRDFARTVLADWDRLAASREDRDEVTGALSVFCTVTASQSVLPEALSRFRHRFPQVQVRLETGYAAEALRALLENRVDVTVAALDGRVPRDVVAHVLTSTELVPVTDGHVQLPAAVTPEWSRVPWVLPAEGLARSLIDGWFRRLRVRPNVVAEATGHEAVLALVALGCGIGLVPRLVAERAPGSAGLHVVRVDPPLVSFDIGMCTLPTNLERRPVAALWRTLAS